MKIAALFHVSFEKLGYIEDWILRKGHQLTEFHLYHGPQLPQIEDFDLLIVMGGSMSIREESLFPWLRAEKDLIKTWIGSGKAIFGICLGAQLLAEALGSNVFRGKNKEIGWFPINLNHHEDLGILFPDLPEEATVFHWHGETFDLPSGAVALASSVNTPCQGFMSGRSVLALQFHLEVMPENISLMINHAGHELVPGPFVQDAEALSAGLTHLPENRQLMDIFLGYFENLTRKK
jgi:GMP synthase-like glutamine amidotransferase